MSIKHESIEHSQWWQVFTLLYRTCELGTLFLLQLSISCECDIYRWNRGNPKPIVKKASINNFISKQWYNTLRLVHNYVVKNMVSTQSMQGSISLFFQSLFEFDGNCVPLCYHLDTNKVLPTHSLIRQLWCCGMCHNFLRFDNGDPFYWHGLIPIPACINNHMQRTARDEIIHLFSNFNGSTVVVWEWKSVFTPDLMLDKICYPCLD